MQINPVSFCAKYRYEIEKEGGLTDYEVDSEMLNAIQARKASINIPPYYTDGYTFTFRTKGDNADYTNNPITQKHMNWLFTELYKMDKANINHRSLDSENVFLAPDGKVELTHFRDAVPFIDKNSAKSYDLPDFIPPSNQPNYEASALAKYINQMSTMQEATDFLKTYMEKSAFFHSVKSRIGLTQEQKDYENLLGQVLKNPDDKMADLYFDKIEFLNQRKLAKDEWENNSDAGRILNMEKCKQSVLTCLDAVELLKKYALKATVYKIQTKDEDKKAYYDYEVESAKYYTDLYLKEIHFMASRVLTHSNNDMARYIDNIFIDMEEADFDHKANFIKEFRELYTISCQI